jgi:hypothetical protein
MLQLHYALQDVSTEEAQRILAEFYDLRGELRPLPGERDRSFYVRAADGRELVLKFTSADDDRSLVELQNAALAHVIARDCPTAVPRIIPAPGGEAIVEVPANGSPRLVRLFSWLPGRPLATVRPHSPELLYDLGASLGALGRALSDFRHPAARRDLKWDLEAADWIADHARRVAHPARRAIIERLAARYSEEVKPALASLRSGVIHNDANDYNVLATFDQEGNGRVSGILDFGDLLESRIICDLAIALAYAMMEKVDPLSAGAAVRRRGAETAPSARAHATGGESDQRGIAAGSGVIERLSAGERERRRPAARTTGTAS